MMMHRYMSYQFGILLSASLFGLLSGQTPAPNALQVISSRGFRHELYSIKANAGYLLTIYRIINPLADPATLNKHPLLYGHGLLFDASSMLSRAERAKPRKPVLGQPTINYGNPVDGSDDYSLPFMLSNNNFDVWMFDSRGTNQINVNMSDPHQFWDFSLDDQALIDLPLIIDFVLTKTASTALAYVGYSESTLFMFALLSTAPEYQNKIVAFIAMAPVAYVHHIKGITPISVGTLTSLTPEFLYTNGLSAAATDAINAMMRIPCQNKFTSYVICGVLGKVAAGDGSGEETPSFWRDFFKFTSLKSLKHFAQFYFGDRFGMYDYGVLENLRRYNQPRPPAYDLSKITLPRIVLIRGLKDYLSTPEDTARLLRELGTAPYLIQDIPNYNHFDFVDGKDLIKLVNAPVVLAIYDLMRKTTGPNILRDPIQNQAIVESLLKSTALDVPDSSSSRGEQQISSLFRGQHRQDIISKSANIFASIVGAPSLFEKLAITLAG